MEQKIFEKEYSIPYELFEKAFTHAKSSKFVRSVLPEKIIEAYRS